MFVVLMVAFVVASGCSDSQAIPLETIVQTRSTPQGGAGSIYAVDPRLARVYRFKASDSGLDVTPQAIITGTNTKLNSPRQLAVDSTRNRLYVLDVGRILVFDNPGSLNGNFPPTRELAPPVLGAQSIAIDEAQDILYLGHNAGLGITAYDNASALNGSITPSRTIVGARASVSSPRGLTVDGNRLFVADFDTDAAVCFDAASTASGDVPIARGFAGAATGLLDPFALALDPAGTLYVSDVTTGILSVFASATTASGNVPPTFSLSPDKTFLSNTRQLTTHDGATLLAAQAGDNLSIQGGLFSFNLSDLTRGEGTPTRVIQAPTAGLSFPTGIAHDPAR